MGGLGLWALLLLGAASPAGLEREVRSELERDGLVLGPEHLELRPLAPSKWAVGLKDDEGQVRWRVVEGVPEDAAAAAATLRMVVLGLVVPYRELPPPQTVSLSARRWTLAGAGLVGGAAGVGLGYLAHGALEGCLGSSCRLVQALPLSATVGALGLATGVSVAADLNGGGGHFAWAMAGATTGCFVAVGLGAAVEASGDDGPAWTAVSMPVLGLGGALLFHELFGPGPDAPWPELLPVVRVDPNGRTLGLRGRF